MELFGKVVVDIIMLCAACGAVASIVSEDSELGRQFLEGINAIGPIFLPVAGIMAAAPFLTKIVTIIFGPVFQWLGADPAIAATSIVAVDMGGYQLADMLAQSRESWIMAMVTGFMSGATIVFSIPVALKMIRREDRDYLALGMMSGFLMIPVGVLISSLIISLTNPLIRQNVATAGEAAYQLDLNIGLILHNLLPLTVLCVGIALGLMYIPKIMIKGFNWFGKFMDSALRIIVVSCIIEYFTGFFTSVFGVWGFEPIIADEKDIVRALEVSGYIGIMLCGAFPMVYLLRKYLAKPLDLVGRKLGLSVDAVAGILACAANALALFSMIEKMQPEDKVKCLAFCVCSAFLIGDHLSFTANFQPSLILPVLTGKLIAGILSVYVAVKIALPSLNK